MAKQRKRKLLSAALVVLFAVVSFIVGVRAGQAATTGTPWSSAKSRYPGSTAGTVGEAAGGIVWSRHNLSSLSKWFQPYRFNPGSFAYDEIATTQICVFCHTPHHAATNGQGPLWNRTNMATGYVAYGPTMAGTNITDVGGASLACLSCHDGITTFDSIINAPGKGMTIPEAIPGFPASAEWAWGMFSNPGGAQIELDHFNADPTLAPNRCGYCHPLEESNRLNIGLGPGSSMPYQGGSIASLSNDHPINVVYATDGRASLRSPSTVISSITMDQPNSASVGRSDNIWSVNGYLNNTATISELLRDGDKVQCASCHDPHYKNQTNTDPGLVSSYSRVSGWGAYSGAPGVQNITDPQHELNDGLFLRRVGGNSNSGVCRTCHAK